MFGQDAQAPAAAKPNIVELALKGCGAPCSMADCGRHKPMESEWPGGSAAVRPFLIRVVNALKRAPQVEYLNSGIAFSSSLVALNRAWSGYHGLGFDVVVAEDAAVLVLAAPVVVAGRLPGAFALLAPVSATGSLTNLTFSNGMATKCSPTPRKPPTPITTALIFPSFSVRRSLIEPMLSLLSL